MVDAAHHMKDIIDSMTNLELIRRGELNSEFKQVSIQTILEKALQGKLAVIKQHGHQMEWLVPMHPMVVNADPEKLPQVFAAILDNAIRFTPDGGRISVSVEHKTGTVEVRSAIPVWGSRRLN